MNEVSSTTNLSYDNGDFSFQKIQANVLFDIWKSMKKKHNSNPDSHGFCMKMLVYTIHSPNVYNVLVHLINSSIESNVYPDCFKMSTVIPLPKIKEANNVSHYRPISLQSHLSKFFEKAVKSQFMNYLEGNNILFDGQFGFRKNHSTEHAVLALSQILHKNLNANKFTAVMALDLQKAFDKVDKAILLKKIAKMGINVKWFNSYLYDRVQVTKINENISEPQRTLLGVPQGSVLGPSLFSAFINDLPEFVENGTLILFADDNYDLVSGFVDEMELVMIKLQKDVEGIMEWMDSNHMKLNVEKTELLLVGTKSMLRKLTGLKLEIGGKTILPKPFIKCLGMFIDCNLSWNHHINHVVKNINFNLKCLYPYNNYFCANVLKILCETLCLSHLQYMTMIWGSADKKALKPVMKCFKSAARFVLSKKKYDSITTELTDHLLWLTPKNLYYYICLSFIKSFMLGTCPHIFSDIFDISQTD